MKKALFLLFGLTLVLLAQGCIRNNPYSMGKLELFITDAPPAANFKEVNVTIAKVEICKENEDGNDEDNNWITLSEPNEMINLLEFSGGKLKDLGVVDLKPGQYNQIRMHIPENETLKSYNYVMVEKDGIISKEDLKVASRTIKLVNPFIIKEGITTQLVVDFNVAHSISNDQGAEQGQNRRYVLTPVTRLESLSTTGAIAGRVILEPAYEDLLIRVTTIDPKGNEISTICNEQGEFTLSFLPAGLYDLTFTTPAGETGVYYEAAYDGVEVENGQSVILTDGITLQEQTLQ